MVKLQTRYVSLATFFTSEGTLILLQPFFDLLIAIPNIGDMFSLIPLIPFAHVLLVVFAAFLRIFYRHTGQTKRRSGFSQSSIPINPILTA